LEQNSMKKLGFLVAIGLGAMLAGCGGGSSTPAAPVVTPSPTASPTPTPVPTPGPVQLAYTSSFGATATATASPAPLGFPAPTLTATLTASQANNTTGYAATSSCASVTVTPATSTSGTFTVTGAKPAATGCSITVTGVTGYPTATVAATVATPAGVQLRWYLPNYSTQSAPIPQTQNPINVIGFGATYAPILAVSEQNYVGGFTAANVTTNAGCTTAGAVTVAPATPVGLPTAAPPTTSVAQSISYYTVTAASAPASTCTITATDNFAPTTSGVSINVLVTSASGTFQ
jgi:hypothetical protein